MGYTTIRSSGEVSELAEHLKGPHRDVPVVVVSSSRSGPVIDPGAIAAGVSGTAEVYLLDNPGIAYEFDDLMPEDTSVYGGGVRSYPVGTGWMTHQHASMVRLAYTPEEAVAAVALVLEDVRVMADLNHPGHRGRRQATAPARQAAAKAGNQVSGTVSMLLAGGAVVMLDTGNPASIDIAEKFPDTESSQILQPGMKVAGVLDGGTLDISAMLTTAAEAVESFSAGSVYPALVAGPKTVALYPGLNVRCRSGKPEGTVIAVTVEQRGQADGKAWKITAAADTAEAKDAPSVIRGGSAPWLTLPAAGTATPEVNEPVIGQTAAVIQAGPASEAQAPADAPAGAEAALAALDVIRTVIESMAETNTRLTGQVDDLGSELADLESRTPMPSAHQGVDTLRMRGHVERLQAERIEMLAEQRRTLADADGLARDLLSTRSENQRLRDGIRIEKERAARARARARANADDEAVEGLAFADPVEQFRHEVYMEWASRIPASSKKDLPLARYDLAEGFLASVEELQGLDRSKVVAVAVEVLTGLAETMPGREMHRLRSGSAGTAWRVEDRELGTAWRVSLQVKTASARRLHFWRGDAGLITFANVGVHDEALV